MNAFWRAKSNFGEDGAKLPGGAGGPNYPMPFVFAIEVTFSGIEVKVIFYLSAQSLGDPGYMND